MITAMGRFAKIWMLAAVFAVVSATWAFAPDARGDPQTEVRGPTYSQRALERFEIEGIHPGMSRDQVASTLGARGYQFRNPGGREGEGHWTNANGNLFLFDFVNRDGVAVVESFVFDRAYTWDERHDIEARRADLIALLGRPTHWMQWRTSFGTIGDTFSYVSDRSQLPYLDDAWSCHLNWRCEVQQGTDCRSAVRRVRGFVVSGSFTAGGLSVEVSDYRRRAAEFRPDRAFRTQDATGAYCPILPV
jgi:hypothetical protein